MSLTWTRLAALRLRCGGPNRLVPWSFVIRSIATDAPLPDNESSTKTFKELTGSVHPKTLHAITKIMGLETMTAVQERVFELLPGLAKPYSEDAETVRDLLVRAKTGTGKTLAFLVPAIEARINTIAAIADTREQYSLARQEVGTLIISPTRELATQIADAAIKLTSHHPGFEVRLFTGGTSKGLQMRQWMKGRRDIVVGTPGRLRDLIATEPDVARGLSKARHLILDEADTLLDMGFQDDLDAITRALPPSPYRQTFLFSATVSNKIRKIALSTLHEKHQYINTVTEEDSPVHANIPQYSTILASPSQQLAHILRLIAHDQLINAGTGSKVIVFLPTTKMTQLYSTLLSETLPFTSPAGKRTRVYEIHSKKTQDARTRTSNNFRQEHGSASVLVTSDVSARGVDYPGVTRVIQVGIPSSTEQYIHRVGRTGRGLSHSSGRGDIVLLPWEVSFLTWQLTDVPLKAVTVSEIDDEVKALAADIDAQREKFVMQTSPTKKPVKGMGIVNVSSIPFLPIEQEIPSVVERLVSRLDSDAISATFASLLGYYVSKTAELRTTKEVILEGLRKWTTAGMGLHRPPYVSPRFLTQIGFEDDRPKRFGTRENNSRERNSRGGRQQSFNSEWRGRGDDGRSNGMETSRMYRHNITELSPEQYRTQRYGAQSSGRREQSGRSSYQSAPRDSGSYGRGFYGQDSGGSSYNRNSGGKSHRRFEAGGRQSWAEEA